MVTEINIKNILESLGYKLIPDSKGWRSTRVFVGGTNPTSLLIHKDGSAYDFVENKKISCLELIQLSLGLKKTEDVESWLKNKNFELPDRIKSSPKLQLLENNFLDNRLLDYIKPEYDYANKRGISNYVCKKLKCGIIKGIKSRLNNRFCFPIFNSKNNLIGLSGRALSDDIIPKYFHKGVKKNWCFPLVFNVNLIKDTKKVILVESAFDVLALMECGINNSICLFGTDLSLKLLNILLKLNLNKIIIGVNNDEINGKTTGNFAAQKLQRKLKKYFDFYAIKVILPSRSKDWNEQLMLSYGVESIKKQLLI